VDPSPTDAISAIKFSPYPNSTKLAAASWDKHVYLYEYIAEPNGANECRLLSKFEHRAPVLDVCFGTSDEELYTAGLDLDVRKCVSFQLCWDLLD
jgi:cell cycle arrest protein BUB3